MRSSPGRGGTSTAADLIRRATEMLTVGPQPETSRLDAELLAAHVAGRDRAAVLMHEDIAFDTDAYEHLIQRRATGEPLAYIIGHAEFWSLTLAVGPAVLIPRADSECLIEAALEAAEPPARILDLGTGSGCLLLAALSEVEGASGTGIDASADALSIAGANAEALGLDGRAEVRAGNWCAGLTEAFDLILCNPPYVGTADTLGPGVREHEPGTALFAGADGLAAYREILPQIADRLAPAGLAIFEIGRGQADAVEGLARAAGLAPAGRRRDLAGHERALIFTLA
ncbi:MAG: peptide chain release factor N(5)-glutamine methyltransferase [Pseudomonadota bacterium]